MEKDIFLNNIFDCENKHVEEVLQAFCQLNYDILTIEELPSN